MFKRAILVDYENVVNEGLAYVDRLSEENKVIIFYSKNANSMTFQTHQKLMESKATIEYMEVTVGGRNALDIQLATYLGYLAGKSDAEEYYMISKDNGFRHVEIFCEQKLHLNISCKPYIGKYFLDDGKEESQITELVKQEEAEQLEEIEQPRQPEQIEQPEQIKQPEEIEQPEQIEQPEEIEQPEQIEQPEGIEQSEKEEQSAETEQKETETSVEDIIEENMQDFQETSEEAEKSSVWIQEQELETSSEESQEAEDKTSAKISTPLALPVKAKAEVFIFNGTGFTKEEDIKPKMPEATEEEKSIDLAEQIQESQIESLDEEEHTTDVKEIKAENVKEKSEETEDIKKEPAEQKKKETHKNKMTGTDSDSLKTKKKKKKNQNVEQKEQDQREQEEKEGAVKLQKAKKKEVVISDEKALENAIQKAFETYRDKKLKTEVMMNFIKTGQKKALYNMLRGKLGQTEGQKVYNILKQYIEEIA